MQHTRRVLYKVHAWIGLNLGLLLFCVCFSGTVSVFGPELEWLGDPDMRVEQPVGGDPAAMSWQRMHDAVSAAYPDALILRLYGPRGPSWVAQAVVTYGRGDLRRVLVNPYTMQVAGQRSTFGPQSFLRILHKQFYIVPTVLGWHGILVVGPLGLAMLVTVVLGLCSYSRPWRSLFSIRFGRSGRVLWSDLHRAAGVWALLVGLLLSGTGVWYLVEYGLDKAGVVEEDTGKVAMTREMLRRLPLSGVPFDLDGAAARARSAFPELKIQIVALPILGDDVLAFHGDGDAWVVRSRANQVFVNPFTGAVMGVRRGQDLPGFDRWIETADPLHFGTLGGTSTRVIWLVTGLLLCGGIVTGLVTFWLRFGQRGDAAPRRHLWAWLAVVPSIAVIAASIHGTFAFGLQLHDQTQIPKAMERLGATKAGPWQVTMYRDWLPIAAAPGKELQILFSGGRPNVAGVSARIGPESALADMQPFRLRGNRASGNADACTGDCYVDIAIEDRSGIRHTVRMPFPIPARSVDAVRLIPPVPRLPAGAVAIVLAFACLLLLPAGGWIYLQFRTSGYNGSRRREVSAAHSISSNS
ncbi:MAG: PepSY-associated TM helix domain-containing protein [Alphaproteobacteria bacterium]